MANTVELNQQELSIQGLIGQYLANRPSDPNNVGSHLDQDTLTAFVEGSLNKRESQPVVGHLVACSFCRHISAELIKLELEFSDDQVSEQIQAASTGTISEVLSSLFSKIFGTTDGAVFAHTTEDEEKDKEAGKDTDTDPTE